MTHNIIPSLAHLAVSIDSLKPLPGNPQEGKIEAHMGVLQEFGQHRVAIVKPDGTIVVGNHMVEAARRLGWTEVAAVPVDDDKNRALARAVSDNRVAELSQTNQALLAEILPGIYDDYSNVLEILDWDEFEVAAISEYADIPDDRGYVPPQIVERDTTGDRESDGPGPSKTPDVEGRTDVDLVRTGAGDTDDKRRAIIQYTLVFSDADQQRRWHDFIKFLRVDPAIEGDTTADKLLYFLEGAADF